MKATVALLALIVLLSGIHVTVPLGAWPVIVPLPALALLAELGVCALLGWLIARSAGYRPWTHSRRTA